MKFLRFAFLALGIWAIAGSITACRSTDPGMEGHRRKDHSLVPVNSDYDLYSMGPDGDSQAPFTAQASRDDIVRASNGGYIGPVIEF